MNKTRGFTLMEVVIAMAMLGAALALSSYSTNLISSSYSLNRRMTRAHDVASVALEELLSNFESDAKLTEGSHTQNYDENCKKAAGASVYAATWTVRHNFPIVKVMEISLRVTWNEDGRQRGVRYLTYRSI